MQKMLKGNDTIKDIKAKRILQGHLNRLEGIKLVKKITHWNPTGVAHEGCSVRRKEEEIQPFNVSLLIKEL